MKETANNDMGELTTIVFLDRHPVDCTDGKALKSWTVLSGGGGFGRVSYSCCDAAGYDPIKCTQRETECTNDGKLEFLDRHHPDCGDNSVITNWRIEPCGPGNVKMVYRCCSVPRGPCECMAAYGFNV